MQMKSPEMKNTHKMKNTLGLTNSILGTTEEKISEVADMAIANIQNEGQKEFFKKEHSISDQWDNIKQSNLSVIGVKRNSDGGPGDRTII